MFTTWGTDVGLFCVFFFLNLENFLYERKLLIAVLYHFGRYALLYEFGKQVI